MIINIANKDYTLYFGWDFLEQVNKIFGAKIDVDGQEINMGTGGLSFLQAGLESYDPITVQKAIQAGTSTETQKPSVANIRKFIESKLTDDVAEYQVFVEEMLEAIKKEPMLKAMANLNK